MSEDKAKGTLNEPFMKSGQKAYDDWDVRGPGPLEKGEGEGALLDQTELFYTKGSARPMTEGYPDLGPTEAEPPSRRVTEEECSPEEMMRMMKP